MSTGPEIPQTMRDYFSTSRIALSLVAPHQEDEPLTLVNDEFLKLSGYSRNEVIGRNCRFLQGPGKENETSRKRIRHGINMREETFVTIENYHKNETPFHNFLFIFPVFDTAGSLAFLLGSQCDVSPRSMTNTLDEHTQHLSDGIKTLNILMKEADRMVVETAKLMSRTAKMALSTRLRTSDSSYKI